ncbi:MAG: hypothetical protein JWM86_563 [Thermoleophilia bacterium]|nr:hypothetical protein [Thermoleophilia bacterium]
MQYGMPAPVPSRPRRARGHVRRLIVVLALASSLVASVIAGTAPGASSSVVVSLDVPSATSMTNQCTQQAAWNLGTVQPGTPATTSNGADVCRIRFSSTNNTSALRMYQADREGTAMARASTTWDKRSSSDNYLNDVDTSTGGKAVAVGSGGNAFVSNNSGASWTLRSNVIGTYNNLNQVDVLDSDPNVIWAVGHDSDITRSIDGGTTWTDVSTSGSITLVMVMAVSATEAWIGGSNGTLQVTTNGGATWTPVSWGSTASINDMQRRTATDVWSTGSSGTIRRSTNGGSTWAPPAGSFEWAHYEGLDLVGPSTIWAAGGAGGMAKITRSTDDGATWQNRSTYLGEALLDVIATTSTEAWAVGRGGTVLYTSDGGSTWSRRDGLVTNTLTGVAIATDGGLLVTTYGGDIMRSTNGGTSWTMPHDQGAQPALSGVASPALDRRTVVAVGDDGATRRSTDLGVTFSSVSSGTSAHLRGVSLAHDGSGWAVGYGGTILRTVNAGASWTPQTSGTAQDLFAVDAVTAQIGWAAGRNGTVLLTVNGGLSWTARPSGTTLDLRAVTGTDSSIAWIGGMGGTLRRTGDGGATWVAQTAPQSADAIYTLEATSPTTVFAAIDWTGAIRTTNAGATWVNAGTANIGGEKGLAVAGDGQSLLIAAEFGRMAASYDGATWAGAGNAGHYHHQRAAVAIDANRFVSVGENLSISVSRSRDAVNDYGAAGSTWASPANGLFGVCLQDVGAGTTPVWTEDVGNTAGLCQALAGDTWNAIPITPTSIATTTLGADAYVDLVWGARAPSAQPAGAYAATVTFETLAPAV